MPINTNTTTTTVYETPFENGEQYYGRIVQIIDIGLQDGGEYLNEKKPDCEQIIVTVEFPEALDKDNNPGWLSLFFKLPQRWENGNFKGIHKKSNTYKLLNLLVPELLWSKDDKGNYVNFGFNFSWSHLLGKPLSCTVSVNDEGKTKILSFDKIPKKYINDVPELISTPIVLDMGDPMLAEWEAVPNWIHKIIKKSLDPLVVTNAIRMESLSSNVKEEEEDTPPFDVDKDNY